ncbi:MAG: hypothetical protein ACETVM_03885 [Candidatus Bathyarchaeia archaeon]
MKVVVVAFPSLDDDNCASAGSNPAKAKLETYQRLLSKGTPKEVQMDRDQW